MFEKLEEEIEVKADEYALEESTACNYGESSKHVYQGYFYGFKKGAEFGYNKAKEEMQEQGLALQSDMDKTIEQNIQLKAQIEKMKNCLNKWYKQHNDDDYTETFYDNLLRDTEKCLWGYSVND